MSVRRLSVGWAISGMLGGCVNLAPHYSRPPAPVPGQWPADTASAAQVTTSASASAAAADIPWQEFIQDPRLRRVVQQALSNSRPLRVAVLDIETARAKYRIQGAALYPTVAATGSESATRSPSTAQTSGGSGVTRSYTAELGFSAYEIDFFGRLRNLKDEALESFLATVETRRSTQISLVAEAANDWLTLSSDMALLELSRQTLVSEQASYDLVERQHTTGTVTGLDVALAKGSVETDRADVASEVSQVAQDRSALNLVVGASVDVADLPDAFVASVSSLAALPSGIPSEVLQRRPDVLSAEHTLKYAHANIGAARAAFFPSITLTAAQGTQSSSLSGLFKAGTSEWTFAPSISVPIFNAGSNRATLNEAKATRSIDLADYELTLQTAFSEVANALAIRATITERLDAQHEVVIADTRSYDLSMALYKHGSYSFLDVLTSQRSLYSARQTEISVQLAAQSNLVTTYKVLGGGWTNPQPGS